MRSVLSQRTLCTKATKPEDMTCGKLSGSEERKCMCVENECGRRSEMKSWQETDLEGFIRHVGA
jgi:hypothetical protein